MDTSVIMPAAAPEKPGETKSLPFEPKAQFRASDLAESAERADNRGKRIGILIVAYNALTTLGKVLRRITPQVWQNVEQVVVFDDASPDATFELAVGIQALTNLPKLHVIKHQKNLGYGGNQKAGYKYFIEAGFDVVVMLHGDGQYAPEMLSHMYAPLVRGEADAVFGSRMMKDYGGPLKGGMPFYKYVGNRLLSIFENKALGLDLSEFHSGYRAYNLHALAQINLDNMTDDFHFDTEIIIKLHHQNFSIHEVPIPTFYGDEVCHVDGMKYARAVVHAVHRYKSTARAVRKYPEYEEYFNPYAIKRSLYSGHYYASRLIGKGQRVLELKCCDGAFGSELAHAGNRVVGLDTEPQVPPQAGYEDVLTVDLEKPVDANALGQAGRFDRILLFDILEHLKEPGQVLNDCKGFMAPRSRIIVSVPNAANITVRLMLLAGGFEYQDRGILDWSHLRFFTKRSARRLLERHGFRITRRHYSIMPIERVIPLRSDSKILSFLSRTLHVLTSLAPGLLAYEIVLVAER